MIFGNRWIGKHIQGEQTSSLAHLQVGTKGIQDVRRGQVGGRKGGQTQYEVADLQLMG